MNQQTNNTIIIRNNKNTTSPNLYSASRANNSSSSGRYYSGSRVIGIVILVIVIILLIIACYWLYTVYSNRVFQTTLETEVMPDVKDAATSFSVGNGSIPSSKYSNEYSISMWLNIDNYTYNYGKEKIIFRRGDKDSGNPEIVLDSKTNDLIVRLKLQNYNLVNTSSVSNFADIPKLSSNNLNCNLGNNLINYPTIQYQQSSCNDNIIQTNTKPTDVVEILLEHDKLIKEGFKTNENYDSAPLDARNVYHNNYFSQISGNNFNTQGAKIKEGFNDVSDLTNACVAVITDLCQLASIIQSQETADNQVESMNKAFQIIIDSLEDSRNNSKKAQDVANAYLLSLLSASTIMININETDKLASLINNLTNNLIKLQTASEQIDINNINLTTMLTDINSKLTNMNCPLVLSGINEVDITTNFYQSFTNLVKKSLYTYFNNIGTRLAPVSALTKNTNIIQNLTNSDPSIETCIYRSIPLQKWVHVIVSVYNQVVDIFIDGQLASSCVLKAFPAISTSSVVITPDGGFAGKISRVIFSNTAMTVQHAKELYYAGPTPSNSFLSLIPTWVWYSVIFLIILSISYSILM